MDYALQAVALSGKPGPIFEGLQRSSLILLEDNRDPNQILAEIGRLAKLCIDGTVRSFERARPQKSCTRPKLCDAGLRSSVLNKVRVGHPNLLNWSGKRDSNSRLPPWQGGALPTELFPLCRRVIKRSSDEAEHSSSRRRCVNYLSLVLTHPAPCRERGLGAVKVTRPQKLFRGPCNQKLLGHNPSP